MKKKIVILGVENTHANAFLSLMRDNPEFSEMECVGIYSDESTPMETLAARYGVKTMASYDEAVGQVDGVIVVARHGDNHYKYLAPYISSGVPVFMDKPITVKGEDAVRMAKECMAAGVRCVGGSCLKFADEILEAKAVKEANPGATGFFRAPIYWTSPYGGYYFYAQHLVEMILTVFGRYPSSARMERDGDEGKLYITYRTEDGGELTVEGRYGKAAKEDPDYQAIIRKDGKALYEKNIAISPNSFRDELNEFREILEGGAMPCTYSELISPVFVMNAAERSLLSGTDEPISYPAL